MQYNDIRAQTATVSDFAVVSGHGVAPGLEERDNLLQRPQ